MESMCAKAVLQIEIGIGQNFVIFLFQPLISHTMILLFDVCKSGRECQIKNGLVFEKLSI